MIHNRLATSQQFSFVLTSSWLPLGQLTYDRENSSRNVQFLMFERNLNGKVSRKFVCEVWQRREIYSCFKLAKFSSSARGRRNCLIKILEASTCPLHSEKSKHPLMIHQMIARSLIDDRGGNRSNNESGK